MLKEQFIPWINAIFKNSGITLHQYETTSYTAYLIKDPYIEFLDKRVLASFITRLKYYEFYCLDYFRNNAY